MLSRYRGTSLIRNNAPLGPYSRTKPVALWWSLGGRALSGIAALGLASSPAWCERNRCRGTSLIRKCPPPQDPHRALGMVLL